MENITQAEISNNAPFLVVMLENARKTHMGIFSVFSIFSSFLIQPFPDIRTK